MEWGNRKLEFWKFYSRTKSIEKFGGLRLGSFLVYTKGKSIFRVAVPKNVKNVVGVLFRV